MPSCLPRAAAMAGQKRVRLALSAAMIVIAIPAFADTIVQSIAFNGNVTTEPVFLTGASFDPALGTLTGVSAVITGQYQADIFVLPGSGLGRSITLQLDYAFLTDGSADTGALGDFTAVTTNGQTYLGLAGFDFTEAFPRIGGYVDGSADQTNTLAAVAFGARPQPLAGFGASDDFSTWSGTMQLTYSYDPAAPVPEPASGTVFAAACLAVAGARRHLSKAV